ncbi:MAG: rod shape-determining protein RodA [Alistipes sp.]|nr:rod shape-determining protein RodA [Alistipes sp.]
MQRPGNNISLFEGVDRVAIILYLLLVLVGLTCVASAGYDDMIDGFFNPRQNHVKQAFWACAAFVVGIFILLLDSRYYHMYAYYAYVGALIFTAGTIVMPDAIAPVTNGAKAWYEIGPVRIQPAEFAKIATALAMARMMSNYSFSINNIKHLCRVAMIILLPFVIILLQNDTGSGVVLGSFLFVLYREGLNKWLCIPILMVATLFIFSFLFTPLILLIVLVLLFTVSNAMMIGGKWRMHIIFVANISLGALLLYAISMIFFGGALSGYMCLIISVIVGVVVAAIYAIRKNIAAIFLTLTLFVGSMIFVPAADLIFESVLQAHQKERILSFLGIINDPAGIDFNVNQSKIAIGSGGLIGKGFMQGTQSKYFVPEKHTDFIFCTAGEEWGFVGSMILLALLCALILRLMKMGERQQEPFSRIYCYSVAAIFLFHAMVNLGMTVGLMPVMGIPLPFVSYGGSSMIAFTILLFIAIRLDASPTKGLSALN